MKRGVWIVIGLAVAAWVVSSRTVTSSTEVARRQEGDPIRVEVLNGSGLDRAGIDLAEALRAKGFDVVDIRNADRKDYEQTLVLDRVGNADYAGAVAEAIGAASPVLQRNDDLLLEVTVVLGRDLALQIRESS